jgi:DNA-binding response OmpR family regulator
VKVLIVEDEVRIAEFVSRGLGQHGFEVAVAHDGIRGLAAALDETVDLLILDLDLPLLPGEELLDRLAVARPDLPVIVLSAKDEVDDRVRNLNAGADDYVTKPFSFAELLARVEARLRDRPTRPDLVIRSERVHLDVLARTARFADRRIELTSREFDLLEALMQHPGQVLTHGQLRARAWGDGAEGPTSNVIEVYVGHLRQKLAPDVIETVRGAGYRFVG